MKGGGADNSHFVTNQKKDSLLSTNDLKLVACLLCGLPLAVWLLLDSISIVSYTSNTSTNYFTPPFLFHILNHQIMSSSSSSSPSNTNSNPPTTIRRRSKILLLGDSLTQTSFEGWYVLYNVVYVWMDTVRYCFVQCDTCNRSRYTKQKKSEGGERGAQPSTRLTLSLNLVSFVFSSSF